MVEQFGFALSSTPLNPSPSRIHFLTFLREPVSRALSEFRHITEGLVSQFGPETFGAAWDYVRTMEVDATSVLGEAGTTLALGSPARIESGTCVRGLFLP